MHRCVKTRAGAKMYILLMAHAETNGTHVKITRASVAKGRKRGDVSGSEGPSMLRKLRENKTASYTGSERPSILRGSDNRLVSIKVQEAQ